MSQGRNLSRCAQICAACLLTSLFGGDAWGQVASRYRRGAQPHDSPNARTDADAAAIDLVDSLFGSFAPEDPLPSVASRALGVEPSKVTKRPKWAARLARNPNADDGNPPFVLIDRYGGIQRYIEPVPQIDLERHVGQTVAVRRDTGGTLLASQLELPRTPVRRVVVGAAMNGSGVRLAAQEEPLPSPAEPTLADDSAAAQPLDEPPSPTAEELPGESIEAGPMMDDGQSMYDGEMVLPEGVDPLYLDGHSELGHCVVCGDGVCGGRGCANGGCGFGSRPVFYARGEYLLWWFDGMNVPDLVVSSDDAIFDLDDPIIFGGNDDVLDGERSGARVQLGYWLDDYGKLAVEGDWIIFGDEELTFVAGSLTSGPPPYIGRPFFNMTPFDHDGDAMTPDQPGPAVEEVDTDNVNGTVTIRVESQFQTAGLHIRRNICCVAPCSTGCGDCVSCGSAVGGCDSCRSCEGGNPACPMCPMVGTACGKFFGGGTRHVDMIYGVRWAQLKDGIFPGEDLIARASSPDPEGTTFDIDENFASSNEFFGGEIGFIVDWERRRWSLELMSKLAIGNTRQRSRISGGSLITQPGEDPEFFEDHALLVQPSNAGSRSRDEFSVLPQIGLTAGYQLTQRLRLTAGYTLLYWTRVTRPGEVIDLDVTSGQIPPPVDVDPDTARPRFVFRDTDIWAHGLNAGLDYRW